MVAGDRSGCRIEGRAELDRTEVGTELRRWLFAVWHEGRANDQDVQASGRVVGRIRRIGQWITPEFLFCFYFQPRLAPSELRVAARNSR
jgi:hypothetical protein